MKKIKGFTLIELLVVIAIIGILSAIVLSSIHRAEACGFWTSCDPKPAPAVNETKQAAEVQKNVIKNIPIPQVANSLERANVAKRAQLFDSPDKISYIYLVNYGKVMAFYTVKGKVSSLRSYMVPTEKLVNANGDTCSRGDEAGGYGYSDSHQCYTINAPDIDGTYGENVSGIFFFTSEGAYVEWKGDYMMSDQPLKLTTQPELVREIK